MGGTTLESGILSEVGEFQVGDCVELAGSSAIVRAVEAHPEEPVTTLIVELLPGGGR